ncbi:MAG: prepilin-type N-terminal cleavage/methylation domain-containing protein [Rubrivivax sp.]|nr:prepilin-type N-terminal cleavage/methylation domain-containing protein [Rubrivivax sp.]
MPTRPRTFADCARTHARGLTLIELCIVLAMAAILVAVAWPSQQAQLQRARRLDGIAALTRLQMAQEQFRARFGRYSGDLASIGSTRSMSGHYVLALHDAGPDTVTLVAAARRDGDQQGDTECRQLTLQLNQGLADIGPSPRCWNR